MARPWYSFYPADYARDTGHLTIVEHGAYRLLMDHYYSSGEPLPTDVERLLRLCRANDPTEQAAVRFVLKEFFVEGDDGYHHVRIDAELVKAAEKAEKCAKAGKVSATKRQQPDKHNSNGRSTDVPTDRATEGQPSQSQSQSDKKKESSAAAAAFEIFWAACPKKEGKGDAEKSWVKALNLTDAETLIAAMQRYAATCAGKPQAERAFIKTPGPWLNAKRWLDEGIAPKAPPDPAVVEDLGTNWGGEAAPLVQAIGPDQFKNWFATAKFDRGPPCQIVVAKQFQRDMIERKFASVLHKTYGHFEVRVAA